MKNGFTPREFAHSIAIDALAAAFHNRTRELDDLTPGEIVMTRRAITKLYNRLVETSKLDAPGLYDNTKEQA